MSRKDAIWLRLMRIGCQSGCHQRADRSFAWQGYQFPICARCTGVILGQIGMVILLLMSVRITLGVSVIGLGIMFIDWLLQRLKVKESTNWRRLITGILGGCGLIGCYAWLFTWIRSLW
ncbi:DUF2085 domain-containing protein [Paenibacillus terrigena]|uniref:DUF2085 domain-containing protein n=1 Tax=Paenibacillus terrigena TaxID=369333 RepID=UPI001B7F9EE6|nr:DUF2085 domain-containing protein [Paenibacillus terrigena]